MRIKFEKDPLAIEQNNYLTKIVNFYTVYDLNDQLKDPIHNFKFRNCLFGAPSIVNNSDEENYVYRGYGITIDSGGFCSCDNDAAGNVIIFGVDSSSLSHSDNRTNNILILGEGPTFTTLH